MVCFFMDLLNSRALSATARFFSKKHQGNASEMQVLALVLPFGVYFLSFARRSHGCAGPIFGNSAILSIVYLPRKAGNKQQVRGLISLIYPHQLFRGPLATVLFQYHSTVSVKFRRNVS